MKTVVFVVLLRPKMKRLPQSLAMLLWLSLAAVVFAGETVATEETKTPEPRFRYDRALTNTRPFNDSQDRDQFTAAVDFILTFLILQLGGSSKLQFDHE